MKELFRIYLTNWINLGVVFLFVYIAGFLSALLNDKFTIREAFFGTTYSVVLYGMLFWLGFILSVFILDTILFSIYREPKYVFIKLIIEWLIISLPFIYWLCKYNQWIFLVAVLAFLIGQYLRQTPIVKLLQ